MLYATSIWHNAEFLDMLRCMIGPLWTEKKVDPTNLALQMTPGFHKWRQSDL